MHGVLGWLAVPVAVADGLAAVHAAVPEESRNAAAKQANKLKDRLQGRGSKQQGRRRHDGSNSSATGWAQPGNGIGWLDATGGVVSGTLHVLRCLSGERVRRGTSEWWYSTSHNKHLGNDWMHHGCMGNCLAYMNCKQSQWGQAPVCCKSLAVAVQPRAVQSCDMADTTCGMACGPCCMHQAICTLGVPQPAEEKHKQGLDLCSATSTPAACCVQCVQFCFSSTLLPCCRGSCHALHWLGVHPTIAGPAAAIASTGWLWSVLHPPSHGLLSCMVALAAVAADYNQLGRDISTGRVGAGEMGATLETQRQTVGGVHCAACLQQDCLGQQ